MDLTQFFLSPESMYSGIILAAVQFLKDTALMGWLKARFGDNGPRLLSVVIGVFASVVGFYLGQFDPQNVNTVLKAILFGAAAGAGNTYLVALLQNIFGKTAKELKQSNELQVVQNYEVITKSSSIWDTTAGGMAKTILNRLLGATNPLMLVALPIIEPVVAGFIKHFADVEDIRSKEDALLKAIVKKLAENGLIKTQTPKPRLASSLLVSLVILLALSSCKPVLDFAKNAGQQGIDFVINETLVADGAVYLYGDNGAEFYANEKTRLNVIVNLVALDDSVISLDSSLVDYCNQDKGTPDFTCTNPKVEAESTWRLYYSSSGSMFAYVRFQNEDKTGHLALPR